VLAAAFPALARYRPPAMAENDEPIVSKL